MGLVGVSEETLRELLAKAYMAGWGQSAEGFNAEYNENDGDAQVLKRGKAWARRCVKKHMEKS